EEYTWQYIADTHSESAKAEILVDIPPAKEFRIHITRFRPGAGAEPHTHEWEHAMCITNGTGKVVINGEEAVVRKGMVAFVPRDILHSVLNIGTDELVVWGVSGPPKTEAGYAQLKKK
ncbi:MAG TPA: cupin domain-containing protein, partial [Thermodesulfobacteriota bacterium]|nr:cupin domain-containing protein [Thermodesulfobacteriota bacterium]